MRTSVALVMILASQIADGQSAQPPAAIAVTPVFSQLVAFTYPREFVPAFEEARPTGYVLEHVLKGETVQNWSQMITLTGAKGGTEPQMSALLFLERLAAGFKRTCPDTYAFRPLGKVKIGGYEGFAALVGCGNSQPETPRSEVALVIAVQGSADVYTLQWAERAAPTDQPPVLDESKWKARYQRLLPIRICDRVQGETAPYPSCVGKP